MIANLMFAAVLAAAPADAVPKFECPDTDINRTYEYRWRAFQRHIVDTPDGKVITEFLPQVGWAGKYNTIVCAAGHHLREARWMHDKSVAMDYARFWFGTNAQHRVKYSSWIVGGCLDAARVSGDIEPVSSLLDSMIAYFDNWESHPIPYADFEGKGAFPMGGDGKGMFTSLADREGSELSLSGDGYRPLFNSAMYGEAKAIAELADFIGRKDVAERFRAKADVLAKGIVEKLWDGERRFFTTVATTGERKAVRELHGYAPWYFGVPVPGPFGVAWNQLNDEAGFAAPYGLTFPERRATGFVISYQGHPCQWNGPSWPFATSVALTALANAIADGSSGDVQKDDFVRILHQYAAQQVRRTPDGRVIPWVDENFDPFSGVWISREMLMMRGATVERGEDYNHSTFADIVISGLCGLRPRLDGTLELKPLIPDEWDYFKLENVRFRDKVISFYWDRHGSRYGKGAGFTVWADGERVHRAGKPESCLLFAKTPRTAAWGDGTEARNAPYFPIAGVLWASEGCYDSNFKVRRTGGATGSVRIRDGVIEIVKTNDRGDIIVEGPAFKTATNQWLRLAADVEVESSNGDICHGFVRAHGRRESYAPDELFERDFAGGGIPQSHGLPESPKGRTYRKYCAYANKDGYVVPAIVVTGGASVSIWRRWVVMDMRAETEAWRESIKPAAPKMREKERMDEAEYDRGLAKDIQHTAKVVSENGVSCLYVDGKKVNPVAYKGPHASGEEIPPPEKFAGGTLQGSGIPLVVKDIRLGKAPGTRGYWTKDGFDAKGAVAEIKNSMRLCPDTPFVIAVGCNAYSDFVDGVHPAEAMRRKDGSAVKGTAGTCLATYCMSEADKAKLWTWPSYSSRVWRDGVKACLRELVAELKAQGLDKRIVGIHTFGYHDGQFTLPFPDYSESAKAEYKEFLKEAGHASTNYEFFAMQTGLRAQEEFVREFKRLMGKDVIGIMWCESPHCGRRATSWNVGAFLRSDAMDILVAQPSYVNRIPGVPGASRLPTASFNLHGKLFFEEMDFRTYAAINPWTLSPSASKGLGRADDLPMWQTMFRKDAGAMVAQRAGWWFYDMVGGWFSAPEIKDDIRTALEAYRRAAPSVPSPWKPGVAIVVDEAGGFGWPGGENFLQRPFEFSYNAQLLLLARSGVPFDIYLAQDVMENPSLLDPYKMIVFGLMRKYDRERVRLVKGLAKKGKTLVHMPRCGELGGIEEAVGIALDVDKKGSHVVTAEGSFPVEVNGLQYHDMLRVCGEAEFPPAHMADWPRTSIIEKPGMTVLARYADDGAVAAAETGNAKCKMENERPGRQIVFTEAGGVSPGAFNLLARQAGACVPLEADVAQVDMNGDFVSVHCLRSGAYDFRLPFDCTVVNLKTGKVEPVKGGVLPLNVEAGDTCQFLLGK